MFKKTIKYTNFADVEVTRDFYFHLSKAELLSMGVSDMEQRIRRITATNDGPAILQEFKAIIEMAVGVRSEDGETFVKDRAAKATLLNSPAYDELLMELCTSETAAAEFINNLIPEKMRKELAKQLQTQGSEKALDPFAEKEDERPAWEREHRNPTKLELQTMTPEQMRTAMAKKLGMQED